MGKSSSVRRLGRGSRRRRPGGGAASAARRPTARSADLTSAAIGSQPLAFPHLFAIRPTQSVQLAPISTPIRPPAGRRPTWCAVTFCPSRRPCPHTHPFPTLSLSKPVRAVRPWCAFPAVAALEALSLYPICTTCTTRTGPVIRTRPLAWMDQAMVQPVQWCRRPKPAACMASAAPPARCKPGAVMVQPRHAALIDPKGSGLGQAQEETEAKGTD